MTLSEFKKSIEQHYNEQNNPFHFRLTKKYSVDVYPKSLNEHDKNLFFIGREGNNKFLLIVAENENHLKQFEGAFLECDYAGLFIKKCFLNTFNRKNLQSIFTYTIPKVLGLNNSFGFGDRLGLANAGHIRSLKGSDFQPILAQQSIR